MESLKEKMERAKAVVEGNAQMEGEATAAHILLKPYVYAEAQKKCHSLGITLDEAVNTLLEKWVEYPRTIGGRGR